MSKFTDWLEEHQDEKCRKCPMFWSDGMYSECGCYIQEEHYGKFLAKLQEKLESGEYGGCFIPMPIIKLAILKGNIKDYFYYKRWEKKHD